MDHATESGRGTVKGHNRKEVGCRDLYYCILVMQHHFHCISCLLSIEHGKASPTMIGPKSIRILVHLAMLHHKGPANRYFAVKVDRSCCGRKVAEAADAPVPQNLTVYHYNRMAYVCK